MNFNPVRAIGNAVSGGVDMVKDSLSDAKDFTGRQYHRLQNLASDVTGRDFARDEAEKQRVWEEMMSSSALQRHRADALAAGYNPLFGLSGGGASTPSGAAAHASSDAGAAASTLSTLVGAVKMFSEIRLNDAHSAKQLADVADITATRPGRLSQLDAGVEEIKKRALMHGASASQAEALVTEIGARIKKIEQEASSAKSQAEIDALLAQHMKGLGGDIRRWSDSVGLKGRDVTQMVSIVSTLIKLIRSGRGNVLNDSFNPLGGD